MSLSAVIIDLDGTIAESHPMAIQLIGGAIAEYTDRDLSPAEVVGLFGPNERGIFRAAVGEERWELAWEGYLDDYTAHHDLCPEPFTGMRELLQRLHQCGCMLGLVTGKTVTTAGISLDYFGIADLFSGVEGGSMDGVVKAGAITSLLDAWGLEPTQAAYVGDTTGDIRESRRAGVTAVAAAWSRFSDQAGLEAELPDLVFTDVAGFARWADEQCCS